MIHLPANPHLQQHYYLYHMLLQGGDISMTAFEEGIRNLSWFRRAFRQRYGVTPKTIRKKG
ncbi:MAG: AraC family transcriptional regulator [Lentisphaeria bacterium]|nr:AraC family transcriptional regulator [Lentisphaeria bacterium]